MYRIECLCHLMLGGSPSYQLLHNDPIALNVLQLEPDRYCHLRRCHVGRFDRPENLPLGAQQDDTPAAFHPAGEFGGGVVGGTRRGGMAKLQ